MFDTKVSKSFNFNRPADEKVENVITRIETSILKYLNRKRKKNVNDRIESFNVRLLKSIEPFDALNAEVDKLSLSEVASESTCREIMVHNSSSHLMNIGDDYYYFDLNPPTVKAVSLPDSIMTGFLVHPNYLDLQHSSLDDSSYHWYLSSRTFTDLQEGKAKVQSIKWELVHDGFVMKTTEEMIGRLLKVVVVPREGSRSGEPYEAFARALVTPAPPPRPYQERHTHTTAHTPQNSLRVVSYNLLADTYACTDYSAENLFPTCPAYALNIFYRRQLLLDEILGYRADVLCLQEVDRDVFKYDLSRVLPRESSLQGCYASKTGNMNEGEAIFYNTDKLALVESESLGLGEELVGNPALAALWEKIKKNERLEERVTTRTSILQVCTLERLPESSNGGDTVAMETTESAVNRASSPDESSNSSSKEFLLVANSHFYYHPDADHIRLVQSVVCFALLQERVDRLQKQGHRVSVVFCGDLNSSPDTGVVQLATVGTVQGSHHGWSGLANETLEGVDFSHSLSMASACGAPEYTNYVVAFNGCLDWIFYQTDRFTVDKMVKLPSHEQVTANTALPSALIPSDHLALVADLSYKQ